MDVGLMNKKIKIGYLTLGMFVILVLAYILLFGLNNSPAIDFFVYLGIRVLLIVSIFFLAYTLFENKLVAYLSILFLILMRDVMNISGYSMIDKIVFPAFLVIPLMLFSLTYFIKEKYFLMFVFLSMSFYIHVIMSIFLIAIYGLYFLFNYKQITKRLIFYGVLFIISLIPLFLNSGVIAQANGFVLETWLKFLQLRVDKHLFFTYWSWLEWVFLFLLVSMFVISFYSEKIRNKKVEWLFIGSVFLFFVALIFTEFIPMPMIIKMSLTRGLIIFKAIAFIYITKFIVESFKIKEWNRNKILGLSMAIVFIFLSLIPLFIGEETGLIEDNLFETLRWLK